MQTEDDKRDEKARAAIIPGCDCFDCANANPEGGFTFTAVDAPDGFFWMPGTRYRVTRSDGADFGLMRRGELLDMRATYGCEVTFAPVASD